MRITNYIPGIQGIASSGIATVNAPVNRRYHSVRVLLTNAAGALTDATTIASLIELIVNGQVMRSGSPATFINLAKLYGYTPATGEVPFFFSEPWRNESPGSMEATSWDLYGQSSFTIRITFLAPGGGVGVQSILADFDGKRNTRRDSAGNEVPFLAIVKQTDLSVNAASGLNDVVTIPTAYPLLRILAAVSANAISKVELFGDGNAKILESTKAENALMLNANGLAASNFEFPLVLDYDNRVLQGLKTSAIDYRVTTSGALTLTLSVHQLVNGFR
jgi:hypothetical protein